MGSAGHRSQTKYYFIAFIALVLIGVVGYSYWQDYRRTREVNRELDAKQREVVSLQTRNVELEDLLKYFDSESYAESRARLELGLVRPGEKVLAVPSPSAAPESAGQEPAREKLGERISPFKAWWSFFFRRQSAEHS